MTLRDRLKAAAAAFRFPATYTHAGGSFLSLAPRTFPYENTDPIANSAVMNVLAWITRNFGQASFGVYQERNGEDSEIEGHPLTELLDIPNEGYGGFTLWAATLLSYHLDGNAYWIKARNARGFGVPTALWYEPHWSIKPHWPDDGSAWIDYYERRVNGTIERIPRENVVHFRNGLNPANPRYGLSPLKAALLQVFTDTEVSLWVAALCRNMAIPGVIVSPTENIGMSQEKAEQIKQVWKRKFGGDNRGEPLILDFQASVEVLGYDPKQMDFGAITRLAESRIAGALGVPAIVAGLSSGLESSTYNNLENLKKSAFEECMIPCWQSLEDDLNLQLLPDFEQDARARGIECEFDTSEVRALQENQGEKEKRAIEAFSRGVTTLNEARAQFGYDPDPAGDYYLLPNNARPVLAEVAMARASQELTDPLASPPETGNTGEEEQKRLLPPSFFFGKSYNWQGLELRRPPSPLEEPHIKAIAAAMAQGQASTEAMLMKLRDRFIDEAVEEIAALDPQEFYKLTVNVTEQDRSRLSETLQAIYLRGATLVREELRRQGARPSGETVQPDEDEFDEVSGAIAGRVANDVQARAVGSATQAILLGQIIAQRIRSDFAEGSTAYIKRGAAEASNTALAYGRAAQMVADQELVEFLVYSAVLDNNTCEPCGEADGMVGNKPGDDVPDVPNKDCLGGAQCRCVLIPVAGNLEPRPDEQPAEPPPPAPIPAPIAEEIRVGDTGAAARQSLATVTEQYARESAERLAQRRALVDEFVTATTKKERDRIEKLVIALDRQQTAAQAGMIDRYRAVIYQQTASDVSAVWKDILGRDIAAEVPDSAKREAVKGLDAFRRLIGDHPALAGKTIEMRYLADVRASAYAAGLSIEMGQWDRAAIYVHEMAHLLELQSPKTLEKVLDFYAKRTAGDEVQKLVDLLPNRKYDPSETTKIDKWHVPYVGKLYLNAEGKQVATEVLSMGLQRIYEDPAQFAKDDPEFFDFIYDLVRMR